LALQGDLEAQKKLLNDSQQQIEQLKKELKVHEAREQEFKELKETEKNTKNQLTTLSAAQNLEYNKLNTDLQAKLEKSLADATQLVQTEQTKLDDLQKAHALDKQRLEQENKVAVEKLAEVNEKSQQQIEALTKERDALDGVTTKHAATIAERDKELADVNEKLQQQVLALTQQNDDAQAKLVEFAQMFEANKLEKQRAQDAIEELAQYKDQLEEKLADAKDDTLNNERKALDDEYAENMEVLVKEEEEINKQIKDIDDEYTKDVEALAKEEEKRNKQMKELEDQYALATGQAKEILKEQVSKQKEKNESQRQKAMNALEGKKNDIANKKQQLEEERTKAVNAFKEKDQAVAKKKQQLEDDRRRSIGIQRQSVNQRNLSGVKTVNQGLTNVRNEMRKVQGSSTPLNSNNNSVSVTSRSNRSISISSVSSIGSVSDLTRSPDPLDQKVAATNLLVKQQSNKTPVVI
ncbi:MAG: hypothetical protein LBE72_02680, partial [Rickettsia sp.]|nr:hypothetical protein [Rickettsia sp.]